jgi:hypothetical protein
MNFRTPRGAATSVAGRRRRRIPNRVLRLDRRAALWAASEDLDRPWLPDSIWQPTSPDHTARLA